MELEGDVFLTGDALRHEITLEECKGKSFTICIHGRDTFFSFWIPSGAGLSTHRGGFWAAYEASPNRDYDTEELFSKM